MPATNPPIAAAAAEGLRIVGDTLRLRRKEVGITAVATAEAAGLSRPTLRRIESGEPSVTAGAYMAVIVALGLQLRLDTAGSEPAPKSRKGWIPSRVRLAEYPSLRELAWQIHRSPELTPREALDIYERNWRHMDPSRLTENESDLIEALREAFER